MVSSATDYKFVTGLDAIKVNGEIMPRRTGEHRRDLRGEDIAFLAEAANELATVMELASIRQISMEDTRLLWSRPYTIAALLKSELSARSIFVEPSTVPDKMVFSGSDGSMLNIVGSGFFNGISRSYTAKSDPEKFYSGALVEQQPIEDMFEDSQKIRSVVIPDAMYSSGLSFSRSSQGPEPPRIGNFHFGYEVDNIENRSGTTYGSADVQLVGGDWHYGKSDHGIPFDVNLYLAFRTDSEDRFPDGSTVFRCWHDITHVKPSVTSAGISLSGGTVGSMARSFAVSHAPLVPFAPSQTSWHNQTVRCTLESTAIQLLRGNHTLY